jgi:hypothetical protein
MIRLEQNRMVKIIGIFFGLKKFERKEKRFEKNEKKGALINSRTQNLS